MKTLHHFLSDKNAIILLLILAFIFYWPFFLLGKIPVPADTIVGMYHPWRDQVWNGYETGVPVKNFLITDPVRQQYVWRKLAVDQMKRGSLPLWNPYSFSGTPLLANIQSAPFYPLNILFAVFSFPVSWGILITLQTVLASLFLYLYLRHIRLGVIASLFGSLSFGFSGFTISWLEWNTIIHVALWLPLLLLAVEKLIKKITIFWILIFVGATISQILAGHVQTLFYSQIIIHLYIAGKLFGGIITSSISKRNLSKLFVLFALSDLVAVLITSIAWIPAVQFILLSARSFDQGSFLREGWFIPWQNLIQFLIPDFFGHPSTLNYFGVWNYGEFIGFIGIIPLLFALFSLVFLPNRKVFFFGSLLFLSLLFALPTPVAYLPYLRSIPFLSSSQPTRLLFIMDFSLSILAAYGIQEFLYSKYRHRIQWILLTIVVLFGIVMGIVYVFPHSISGFTDNQIRIARHNSILPLGIFIVSSLIILAIKNGRLLKVGIFFLLLLTVFDLFRFGWKFIPFTSREWLFPKTAGTELIISSSDYGRIQAVDRRIFPPNFTDAYHIYDVSGYDPLYLLRYGQFVASWERKAPDIGKAAFNRILTPQNYDHFIANLLGVEYILSLKELPRINGDLIFHKGETFVYKNKAAFPRAFLVYSVIQAGNAQDAIEKLYQFQDKLREVAIVEKDINLSGKSDNQGKDPVIEVYEENYIKINVRSQSLGLLILSDTYYPTWKVYVDGVQQELLRADFVLRAVSVPEGNHIVEFRNFLL